MPTEIILDARHMDWGNYLGDKDGALFIYGEKCRDHAFFRCKNFVYNHCHNALIIEDDVWLKIIEHFLSGLDKNKRDELLTKLKEEYL